MGVLNVTPDSFSDGGAHLRPEAAIARARAMVAEGADIIDIGGESTRPGAAPVAADEEIARVVPVIAALAAELDVPLSVDTSKPEVMRAACAAGAELVNDVRALRVDGALDAAAELGVGVVLMHMQGEPGHMQDAPHYDDVLSEVAQFLAARAKACEQAGISPARIALDPGFGFGKTAVHNLALLGSLHDIVALGYPVLAGLSRKRLLGQILGDAPVGARLHGSVAAALIAAQRGARILRVHDVAATRDALAVWQAVQRGTPHD